MAQSVSTEGGQEKKLGSYHHCYRLDGRLVAMGVLDLLPESVSSVYLMYHHDVNDWKFGKLSALREIDLAVQGGYRYYYMGYYIHSCVKMRYKAAFKPTYVLDPETYGWDLLDADMLRRMSVRKYVSMSRERKYDIPVDAKDFLTCDGTAESELRQKLKISPDDFKALSDYLRVSHHDELNQSNRSVFEAGTPGVITLPDLARMVDLNAWGVRLGRMTVTLEDLVGWDEGDPSDPSSLKGVAAELAACVGPDLVRRTMLQFH